MGVPQGSGFTLQVRGNSFYNSAGSMRALRCNPSRVCTIPEILFKDKKELK